MIEVKNIVFDYPGTRALDHVSFFIRQGSVTALVGPNGAGKTTLLRSIAALEQPVAGTITVDGMDVRQNPRECHRRLGFLSDFYGLYDELTVRQCLSYFSLTHRVAPNRQDEAVQRAAARLDIVDRLDTKAGKLSRGLRQRLAIAQAIVHEPQVLLLDEPASGLDPEARHQLAQLFLALQRQGMTLLVSSHILAELAEYSTDMLVLRHGVLVSQETVAAEPQATVMMRVVLVDFSAGTLELIRGLEGVSDAHIDGGDVLFTFSRDPLAQHRLLKEMLERGVPVRHFAEHIASLQQKYLATVEPRRGGTAP